MSDKYRMTKEECATLVEVLGLGMGALEYREPDEYGEQAYSVFVVSEDGELQKPDIEHKCAVLKEIVGRIEII